MRILIVDDEQGVREALRTYVQHHFPWAELLEAASSRAARDVLRRCLAEGWVLDVLVLDIALRRDDQLGAPFDLALGEEARAMFPFSLIIHYSGYTDDPDVHIHADQRSVSFVGHYRLLSKSPGGAKRVCDTIQAYNDLRIRFLVRLLFGEGQGMVPLVPIEKSNAASLARARDALLAEVKASFKTLCPDTLKVVQEYGLAPHSKA